MIKNNEPDIFSIISINITTLSMSATFYSRPIFTNYNFNYILSEKWCIPHYDQKQQRLFWITINPMTYKVQTYINKLVIERRLLEKEAMGDC